MDDRTFGAYANSVESLNTTSTALPSLDNFVTGQIRRFQTAINPQGYPGGTYTTPVSLPSFNSKNSYNEFALYLNDNWQIADRWTVNLGLRYEYYGPQTKSDPKYDSNFYYPDENASVNSGSPQEIVAALQGGRVYPSNESPIGQLWASDWNNWAPRVGFAWDVRGDGKTSVRGGYGMAYERNFGNVTYNVLFNPPDYLVASIDAPTDVPCPADLRRSGGAIRWCGWRDQAHSGRQPPPRGPEHRDSVLTFLGPVVPARGQPRASGEGRVPGSKGRRLYDLADPNKRGAALVYTGVGTASPRPNTSYAAFNSRGNRGESDYNGVTFSLESRRLGKTGLQFNGSLHPVACPRQSEQHLQRLGRQLQPRLP